MYNVLEALREGRALSAKEKVIHTQGLVSVLKDLHDELDAAVLQAYGWDDLTPTLRQAQGGRDGAHGGRGEDGLLTRLVALNAQRALEEKTGRIRWLRPEFQNPAAAKILSNQEQLMHVSLGLQAEMALDMAQKPPETAAKGANTQPWPAALPDQVRALAQVLATQPGAMTLSDIEARSKAAVHGRRACPAFWKRSKRWAARDARAMGGGGKSTRPHGFSVLPSTVLSSARLIPYESRNREKLWPHP